MKVHLIAVQAEMRLSHYRSPEAFADWILELSKRAVEGLDNAPKLLAFPETIGLPLLLTLSHYAEVSRHTRVTAAALGLLKLEWRAVLRAALRHRAFGPQALFVARALPVYRAYVKAFAEAARRTGATIVAGSSFLPHIEDEAARGLHVTDGRVRNVAYTFSPTGRILGRSAKRYLTRGLESRLGLSRAAESPHVLETPAGRVGVAVCLDGFHSSVLETFDGLGAEIVVQPSANYAPWTRRWPPDEAYLEGEAWLSLGLRALLQGRQSIRYGVNPMLVGEMFELRAEGRTSIVANPRYLSAETEGYGGVLALAGSYDREEIVRAVVELPELRGSR
jgi:predicted amidohydrolase